jgi:hypothetical protein
LEWMSAVRSVMRGGTHLCLRASFWRNE